MATFLVDMDSVCNDLWAPLLAGMNKEFDKSYTIGDVKSWDLHANFPGYIVEWIHERVRSPGFFRKLPIREGCYDALQEINNIHKVIIVTAHPGGFWRSQYYHSNKMDWVAENLSFMKPEQVVFTATKNIVRGDVLVDDAPKNLKEFDRITIAFDHPYNRKSPATFRAKSWDDVRFILLEIGSLLNSGTRREDIWKAPIYLPE